MRNALVKFSDTSLTLCLDYANKLNSGKEGWGTLCSDENSQSQHRRDKHQIAISSSSERDKGTISKDPPCSESQSCEERDRNRSPKF